MNERDVSPAKLVAAWIIGFLLVSLFILGAM